MAAHQNAEHLAVGSMRLDPGDGYVLELPYCRKRFPRPLMLKSIPMIDLFAGPGGLSEGFSRFAAWSSSEVDFRSVLSIEKSAPAAETLRLRTFFRKFAPTAVPTEYWHVVKGEAGVQVLAKFPEWAAAEEEVWQAELGSIPLDDLHGRINRALAGRQDWVLLGGPPCQAYSLAGRARMTGIGYDARSNPKLSEKVREERLAKFGADRRHTLYREYLRIIAVHQPALFVMENVKGILSAKVPGENAFMFDRIRNDLQDPWSALEDDKHVGDLRRLSRSGRPRYRLHPFAPHESDFLLPELDNRSFLIRAEDFGIPQKRHRVIVLGVREDIEVLPGSLAPRETTTVRDAIGHLPELRSGISRGDDTIENWLRERRAPLHRKSDAFGSAKIGRALSSAMREDVSSLTRGGAFVRAEKAGHKQSPLEMWLRENMLKGYVQHETRGHMASDLSRYLYAAAAASVTLRSPKLQEWPIDLLPAHRNVSVSKDGDVQSDGFDDRFKVQVWGEPSSTVTAHIAKDGHYFIHPDPKQTRSLTVREAARLQTFPDNYFFCGNRTEAYTQIGNAVPPLLGVQLAGVVAGVLAKVKTPKARANKGELVNG